MLRSTFLGYKTATSALKVNQNVMDIVGQNISNINTEGYTRQRLDINSVSFNASNIKLNPSGVIIGQGVEANGVSQFRDSFLDLRYRMEASKAGSEYVQLEALSDLESVLDEISKDGLDAQFSDLIEQLHSLTSSPSDPVLEGVVRTSAQMLTQMFNDYSEQIDTINNQQLSYLENGAIVKINQITENIAKLNNQIKADNISGNPALELNDERNMLIDELSNYLDIEVDVVPLNIGGNKTIDEIVIKLRDISSPEINLVNRENNFNLSVDEDGDKTIIKAEVPSIDGDGNIVTIITDISSSIKGGQIEGYLKFLNGNGEFAPSTDPYSKVKGVQYYQNMLDSLANKFALVMNEVNRVPKTYDTDGKVTSWDEKPLFDARGGGDITAGNIKIHDSWASETDSYITNTIKEKTGDSTGATDNILRMISKFQAGQGDHDFIGGTTTLFNGTFQEFLSFTTTSLNLQVDNVQKSYDTFSESQYQIDYARSSMSSVDLNEEGVNLLQYSKSYNAAARLMTTLDEMLDTLINRMGV
ncbi:MAG: flagellar hook-associated protein FlgK [Sedimentibacter sp.]